MTLFLYHCMAFCDSTITSTTSTDTISCDFEMILGFFVDDVLVEERIISHSSNKTIWRYQGRKDILDKTKISCCTLNIKPIIKPINTFLKLVSKLTR